MVYLPGWQEITSKLLLPNIYIDRLAEFPIILYYFPVVRFFICFINHENVDLQISRFSPLSARELDCPHQPAAVSAAVKFVTTWRWMASGRECQDTYPLVMTNSLPGKMAHL